MELTERSIFQHTGRHFGVSRLDISLAIFRENEESVLIWHVGKRAFVVQERNVIGKNR